MDRTAAAPAASDEVVKKYTRELPQNSCVQTILVPADSAGNGPSVPQTQQRQQQSPSTLATVTQQQNPPVAADDRFIIICAINNCILNEINIKYSKRIKAKCMKIFRREQCVCVENAVRSRSSGDPPPPPVLAIQMIDSFYQTVLNTR